MDNVKVDYKEEFAKLPVSKRARLAEELGLKVGKILNTALAKANKMMNPYGFTVTIDIKFHETPDKTQD